MLRALIPIVLVHWGPPQTYVVTYNAFYHRCIEYVNSIVLNIKGIQ